MMARINYAWMLSLVGLMALWPLVLAGFVGWWASDRNFPTHTMSAVGLRDTAVAGRMFPVKWEVERNEFCWTKRSDYIFDKDDVRYTIPQQVFQSQPGPLGYEKFVTMTPVPADVPPGPARLRVIFNYVCNPLQWVLPLPPVTTPDIPFTVLPPSSDHAP